MWIGVLFSVLLAVVAVTFGKENSSMTIVVGIVLVLLVLNAIGDTLLDILKVLKENKTK